MWEEFSRRTEMSVKSFDFLFWCSRLKFLPQSLLKMVVRGLEYFLFRLLFGLVEGGGCE